MNRDKIDEMLKDPLTPISVNITIPIMHIRALGRRYAALNNPMDYEGLIQTAIYELSNQQAHEEIRELTTP